MIHSSVGKLKLIRRKSNLVWTRIDPERYRSNVEKEENALFQ